MKLKILNAITICILFLVVGSRTDDNFRLANCCSKDIQINNTKKIKIPEEEEEENQKRN